LQARGGQKETRSQFAHEREIRPTKRFSRHGFGKNTKHHHQIIAAHKESSL
jgi:hypothetical protein